MTAFKFQQGQRGGKSSPIFDFTRALRGHPELSSFENKPAKAFALIEKHIRDTWGYSKHEDPWLELFSHDKPDARAAFVEAWQEIRFHVGQDPLEQARDRARQMRLWIKPDTKDLRSIDEEEPRSEHDYEFFVSLAGWLQVSMGNRPIYLPCIAVGELMGVSPCTISRYRRWAVKDQYLRETKPHQFRSGGGGEATEFRFNVSLYPVLSDKAQWGSASAFAALE